MKLPFNHLHEVGAQTLLPFLSSLAGQSSIFTFSKHARMTTGYFYRCRLKLPNVSIFLNTLGQLMALLTSARIPSQLFGHL